MAHRIEPRLRSPKNEQPSQPAQKLHIEVPATPSVRKDLNTSPSPKIITFAFSLAVVGFLIYQKPSFDETVLAWAQKMLSETNTILKTLTNDAQAALSGPSRKALAINTPTGSRTSQAEWISEAKILFFSYQHQTECESNHGLQTVMDIMGLATDCGDLEQRQAFCWRETHTPMLIVYL